MKISEKWLREWVSPKVDTDGLAHMLTMAGLEVGAIEPAAPPLDHVVVGRVVEVNPHPDADRLRLCKVDAGKNGMLDIVCGAPNVAAGTRVPVALPGATLPNGTTIKRARVRGVESAGMLCSAAELGLAEEAEGLLELDSGLRPGTSLAQALQLPDSVIEIDLTPNRGDCLGVGGIAREVSALSGLRVRAPALGVVAAAASHKFPVRIAEPAQCARYCGRVIRDIDPQARTPLWMRERLRRGGQRPIHPVVDVTNYVMLELGQPMHAFDLDRLDTAVEVRGARKGESIRLLDGSEQKLAVGTLLIADRRRPLALAGIMGGEDSAVTSGSCNLFLESAWFAPAAIAGRARSMGLQTESSYRFERGVDPTLQRIAIERATRLLLEIVGGSPGPVLEQVQARHLPRRQAITLRRERVQGMLGGVIPDRRIQQLLERVGLQPSIIASGWRVTVPPHRFDIQRECDLIEELARLHGYQNIPATRPKRPLGLRRQQEAVVPSARLADMLVDRGYQQVISYSFVDPALNRALDPGTSPVALANPISADMSVMRSSMLSGLVQAAQYNLKRQQDSVRLFEIGRVFLPLGKGHREVDRLGALVTGPVAGRHWDGGNRLADLFDLKGDLEALLVPGGDGLRLDPVDDPVLHPGQSGRLVSSEGHEVGRMGMLHPGLSDQLELEQPVYVFEADLGWLCRARIPAFRPVSRFPAIRRDLSVTLGREIPARAALDLVTREAGGVLTKLELIDVYRGEGIDSKRKSLTFGLTLQDTSRTLRDDEIGVIMDRIVAVLRSELNAQLRQ